MNIITVTDTDRVTTRIQIGTNCDTAINFVAYLLRREDVRHVEMTKWETELRDRDGAELRRAYNYSEEYFQTIG